MLIFVKWHESKKENVILSQFCMGTKLLSDVGVCAALFRRKIWTKGGWYFLLVALYYCKIQQLLKPEEQKNFNSFHFKKY